MKNQNTEKTKDTKNVENKRKYYDWTDIAFKGVIALGVITLVVALMFSCAEGMKDIKSIEEEVNQVTEETIDIVSISTQKEQTGQFYLGFGRLNNVDYYVCYKVREDGGKEIVKFDVDKTIIYDVLNPGDTAYAEVGVNSRGYIRTVKLYVPKDTIQTDYDLSLD